MLVCKKMPNDAVTRQTSIVFDVPNTMSAIEVCGVTALFGIFLGTKKHQNLMRLSSPIIIAYMQSMSLCFITSPGLRSI